MRVYLDNSATTAMAAEVIDAMLPYFSEEMGNAQSVHSFGQRAKSAIEKARRHVAALINASPAEIVFVSGGTEADNFALRGIAEAHRAYGQHIVTTKIEHPAVLATCESLEGAGFRVTHLPVSRQGFVNIDDVREAISDETILISVMLANNETGTIQPIEEISELVTGARRRGLPATRRLSRRPARVRRGPSAALRHAAASVRRGRRVDQRESAVPLPPVDRRTLRIRSRRLSAPAGRQSVRHCDHRDRPVARAGRQAPRSQGACVGVRRPAQNLTAFLQHR